MAKKTLILSQKQLDEICGGDSTYLDGLSLNPDKAEDYSNDVTADGAVDTGYAKNMTTDMYAADTTNNWPANAKLHGMGPVTLREMTKQEFEKIIAESPNQRLQNMRFGESQRTIGAATQAKSKMNKAKAMAKSDNPVIREKGMNTLNNMDLSGIKELEIAQNIDRNIQQAKPEGEKIASAPKQSGNGKAHSPKDGVFLNESGPSIKSQKLLSLIQQHGGIYKEHNDVHKDYRSVNVDLHNLSDDDVLEVVNYEDVWDNRKSREMTWALKKKYQLGMGIGVEYLRMNDGTAIAIANNQRDGEDPYGVWAKRKSRWANPVQKPDYRWKSQDAQTLAFKNPYYKDWSEKSKEDLRAKIRQDYNKE